MKTKLMMLFFTLLFCTCTKNKDDSRYNDCFGEINGKRENIYCSTNTLPIFELNIEDARILGLEYGTFKYIIDAYKNIVNEKMYWKCENIPDNLKSNYKAPYDDGFEPYYFYKDDYYYNYRCLGDCTGTGEGSEIHHVSLSLSDEKNVYPDNYFKLNMIEFIDSTNVVNEDNENRVLYHYKVEYEYDFWFDRYNRDSDGNIYNYETYREKYKEDLLWF
jgi:hypothetical protein